VHGRYPVSLTLALKVKTRYKIVVAYVTSIGIIQNTS
jgi:hypothetical protein